MLLAAALLWLGPQVAAYVLLRQEGMVEKALAVVQESLADSYGLDLRLQKLAPGPGLGFQAVALSLRDLRGRGQPEVLRAQRLYVRLSLLNLLLRPRHPEAAVSEIHLDQPFLTVSRAADNSWIWERFLTSPQARNYFRPSIRLHGARLSPPDELLPHPLGVVTISDGLIDLRAYPRIRGWAQVAAGIDPGMGLMIKADYDTERASGWANLNWSDASPAVWQRAGWIPEDQARIDRGRLSGDARISLGHKPAALTIRAELTAGRVLLPRIGLPPLSVQGRLNLRGKQLELSDLEIASSRNRLSGSIGLDLREHDPPIRADLTLSRLDLSSFSRLYPELGAVEGSASGKLQASGRLSSPVLQGRLELEGALHYPGLPPLDEISVRGRFAGQGYDIQALQARFGSNTLTGQGRIELWPAPSLELAFGSRRLDLAEILDGLGQPGWRGSAVLEGRLTAQPGSWRLAAATDWRRLAWQDRAVPDGRSDLTFSGNGGGDVQWSGEGRIGAGSFQSAGRLESALWNGWARLINIDLAPAAAIIPQRGWDPAGRVTADLSWRGPLGEPDVTFLGAIDRPSLAGRDLDTIQAHLRWRGTEVFVETAQFVKGSASGSIQGSVDLGRQEMALDLALHQMPLALIEPGVRGRVEARLKAGGWIGAMTGEGWAHLSRLAWQDLDLGAARVEFGLEGDEFIIRRGTLEADGVRLGLNGRVALGVRHEIDLTVPELSLDAAILSAFLPPAARPRGRLTGEARITGTPADPIVDAEIRIGAGQAYDLNWESMEADLHWRDGLTVKRGVLRAAGAEAAVAGTLGPSGWDLAVRAERLDLAAARDILAPDVLPWPLAGRMELDGKISGPLPEPVLQCRVGVEGFSLGRLESEHFQGELNFARGRLVIHEARAWTGQRVYAAEGWFDPARRTMDLTFLVDRGDLAALLDLAGLRNWPVRGMMTGSGRIAGRLDRPEIQAKLGIEEGRLGETAFTGGLAFDYDGQILQCREAELAYEGGRMTATGRLGASQCLVSVAATGLPMADLSRLAGFKEMIQGRADLRLSIDRAGPEMRGEFRVELRDQASLAGIPLDRAVAEGLIDGRRIIFSQAELVSGGDGLSLAGYLPWPEDLGPLERLFAGIQGGREEIDLTVRGENVPLALLNPALGEVVSFGGGRFDASARLRGTWAQPAGEGRLVLRGGEGRLAFLPVPFRELEVQAVLAGRSFLLEEAAMRVGEGAAAAAGSIILDGRGPSYDLRLKTTRLPYKDPSFFDGLITADLAVKGGPVPRVEGTAKVMETRITVGQAADVPPPPPIGLDLMVSAGKDVRFFLPGVVDLPIDGELQLRGTLAAPTLAGVVAASRGTVLVYGEYFDVHKATGLFSHDRGYLPYVDLEGGKVLRGINVFVRARGEISDAELSIALWSEPALSQQEILDLLGGKILPGKEGKGALPGGLDLVIGTVFGQLSDNFRRWIDADQFQVSMDDETGVFSLELGKYVSRDFYLSYEVLFDEPSTRIWSFDYELTPNLVLSGIFSTTEEPKWALSYQIRF